MGLCCRKVSGSGESSRGQSFFPALFPNELRSFLASFFGVFASVSSSSTEQLHSSTLSSNSGAASLLQHSGRIRDSGWRKPAAKKQSPNTTEFKEMCTPECKVHKKKSNRYIQDVGAFKADVGDRSVHHRHLSVKHLWANLQQAEQGHAARAWIINRKVC